MVYMTSWGKVCLTSDNAKQTIFLIENFFEVPYFMLMDN